MEYVSFADQNHAPGLTDGLLIWGCFKIIKGNADDSVQGGMKEKTARTVLQRLRSGKSPWHC
ncbi:hypothetical protein DXB70_13015 [Clostridium sp. OM05-5BH]|nr:hypothetical protein DXB70_13015 [Clostridium sp. OM05-5BH]